MARPPLPIPLAAFAIPIEQIGPAWLELHCCSGLTFVPVGMVARPKATLGSVLTRLRCRSCRQPPRAVALVDNPAQAAAHQTGGPPGWRVELTGPQ